MKEHTGEVEARERAPRFAASCSCGWTHDTRHAERTARQDLEWHLAHVDAAREGRHVIPPTNPLLAASVDELGL